MKVSMTDAQGRLVELVRRAEAGEYVVLTRDGDAVVRLVSVKATPEVSKSRRALLEAVRASAAARAAEGPSAARSQDFLYGEVGQPE